MQIVLVSDSHGHNHLLKELENTYPQASLYLHCGDLEDDDQDYSKWIVVRGNNDYLGNMVNERVIPFGQYKIYMCHGHKFSYMKRDQQMAQRAMEFGCDFVFSGHTHVPRNEVIEGILFVNPGSLWMNRDGSSPSYALIEDVEEGLSVSIIHQEDWPFAKVTPKKKKRFWF